MLRPQCNYLRCILNIFICYKKIVFQHFDFIIQVIRETRNYFRDREVHTKNKVIWQISFTEDK
jgi:hypothetical protein